MDVQKLFASRIGGEKFGKINQTFKFTLIDNAKRDFKAKNPGVKVIDMGVGEPEEIPSPEIIGTLAREAAVHGNRIYPNNGVADFKRAAARYLERSFGIKIDPETEVVHCIGSKTGLAQIPLAFVNPGDAVISTAPGYPTLPKVSEWLGARNVLLPLHASNAYLPNIHDLTAAIEKDRPKIVLLNYPNNPTGGIASIQFYEKLVALAHKYTFLIVQDAAYADFVFDGDFASPLQVDGGKDVTLELYSLSKGYNMQGYRLGFVVGSAQLVRAFALVKDNTDNGQFIAIQRAGIEALDNSQALVAHNREKYLRRLKRTVQLLTQTGIVAKVSPGTFYLYCPVPERFAGMSFSSAQAFSDFLIASYGLVSVPWDEAGPHVRLSMTFEVGNEDFASEDEVFAALEERLGRKIGQATESLPNLRANT